MKKEELDVKVGKQIEYKPGTKRKTTVPIDNSQGFSVKKTSSKRLDISRHMRSNENKGMKALSTHLYTKVNKGNKGRSVSSVVHILWRILLSSMTTNVNQIRKGLLFRKFIEDKVINNDLASEFQPLWWKTIEIGLTGACAQLVQPVINFKYPTIDINVNKYHTKEVTKDFHKKVLIGYWVNSNLIDDELYTIIKWILANFHIYIDYISLKIWLVPKALITNPNYKAGEKQILEYWEEEYSEKLQELLSVEINLWYTNEDIWDENRGYAYTHMLRRNLKLKLQPWQISMIINWKQYNFIAGSRRVWKTFTSAYVAYRELYRKGSWFWDRKRQVLYVTLNDNKAWQPFQYMMSMTERDRELWLVVANLWRKEFTCTITGTKILFITAWARWGAASYGADLVVIDEAAMIPNEFWEDLLPIIVQEWATVFAISTINETSRKNWFYTRLLRWETGWDAKANSIRVTIDDNALLTEELRKEMRDELVDNQLKYWTQLYSIFPSWSTVFNLNGVIQTIDLTKPRQAVIIWYDPAKLWDNASFTVVDPETFEVIEEHIFKWVSYMEQKNLMKELKKKFHKSVAIMDRSGVWEGVYEIFWDLIDYSVRYKATGDIAIDSKYWYYKVSKGELVDTLRLYLEEYWLKIAENLANLISEIKGFKVLKDKWSVLRYGWVGITDDSVNSLSLITFAMKHILCITKPINMSADMWAFTILPDGNIVDNRQLNTKIFELPIHQRGQPWPSYSKQDDYELRQEWRREFIY